MTEYIISRTDLSAIQRTKIDLYGGIELVRCKDCRYKPTYAWSGCPMAGLNYVEYGYCYKAEREPKRKPQKGKKNEPR